MLQQNSDQHSPPPHTAPIVIVKKVTGHGGHHGGAWKVAYADFVTAMMALFIVLWLLSSSDQVKKAVGGYFLDPTSSGKLTGSSFSGSGESLAVAKDDMASLREKLQQAMEQISEFQRIKDQVQMTVTGEGLRVELLETEKGMFFETGKPQPTPFGGELLFLLAAELGKLPNTLLLEGHTDAKPYAGDGTYTNWELSTDRANAARRLMETHGLRPGQVVQIRGFADQKLRRRDDPTNASNRRISLIVQYLATPPAGNGEKGQPAESKGNAEPAAARKEGSQ